MQWPESAEVEPPASAGWRSSVGLSQRLGRSTASARHLRLEHKGTREGMKQLASPLPSEPAASHRAVLPSARAQARAAREAARLLGARSGRGSITGAVLGSSSILREPAPGAPRGVTVPRWARPPTPWRGRERGRARRGQGRRRAAGGSRGVRWGPAAARRPRDQGRSAAARRPRV
ncbi:hypothetical protein PVAP13_1NG424519 [Panicum virgatum]|uniref:Uncharacterized protein n=1 Tax=Panicum virgatum TaxID=38727 RepID=A0A8T0X2M9_PANVG|nr:hypothetical protein PVAP13_1NG424519 [Panicum virgatum]